MQQYLIESPVACLILVITFLTSIYAFNNLAILDKTMLHPYSIWRKHNWYTLITSGLVHKDWTHLLFNMVSFYFFAFRLESTIGHFQFALVYFGGMVMGDLGSLFKHKNDYNYRSLGASGAVCAIVFSSILFSPLSKMYLFPIPIGIPAVVYGIGFLGYCIYASKHDAGYINHDAHFLGALSGVVITIILYPEVINYFIAQIFSRSI